MSDESSPDLFAYLSYRDFLADWFAHKKRANPRYSYRVFSRAAGVRSSGLFLEVARGRRNLTANTLPGFVKALGLSRSAARFFEQLVALDQAGTPAERNAAYEVIGATRGFREARRIEDDGFAYFSCWYYPAIRELASTEGFVADPTWIASVLHPRVSVSEAREALEGLVSLGLLVRTEGGRVVPADADVVTPHEVFGLAVYNYHRGMLARATEALDTVPPEQRHYGAVTVAVPEELVPRLKEEVGAFQERLLALAESAQAPDRVYQLNLQLFPLSKTPEDAS